MPRIRKKVKVEEEIAEDSVGVHCSHTEMVPIGKLVENPRNPNKHPERQLKLLSKIIQGQGWRSPVVVSKRSGFIVKGHGRYQAALLAGLEEVPVDYQEYDSEASEWADMIADNRIAELSEISFGELDGLLTEFGEMDFDFELTGFTPEYLGVGQGSEDTQNTGESEEDSVGAFSEVDEDSLETEHTCPKCGYEF